MFLSDKIKLIWLPHQLKCLTVIIFGPISCSNTFLKRNKLQFWPGFRHWNSLKFIRIGSKSTKLWALYLSTMLMTKNNNKTVFVYKIVVLYVGKRCFWCQNGMIRKIAKISLTKSLKNYLKGPFSLLLHLSIALGKFLHIIAGLVKKFQKICFTAWCS